MSGARLLWSTLLSALLALGCRAGEATSAGAGAPGTAALSSAAAVASNRVDPVAPVPTPTVASLPKLKPIQPKPFPEGVDEATVCEAIDSKEPDLWLRFGHLVPAYVTGAIYVLETGPETKDKLFKYIQHDYVYGYYSQQASCRGNLTLLYIRLMFDKSEYHGKPFGREHLSGELEKRFGIKTRESFQLVDDQERLSDYCRAEGDLCERLVKVDRGNAGKGLCPLALYFAGTDALESQYGQRCLGVPIPLKACAQIRWRPGEARREVDCRCRLRDALGLQLSPECARELPR